MNRLADLSVAAGFPLHLDLPSGELHFGGEVAAESVSRRTRDALRPVLADPAATGPETAYTMYRHVGTVAGRTWAERRGLRYDLTVLAAGRYGREFVKTFGHDHPRRPGTQVTYPEIYQVVLGRAMVLLQRRPTPGSPLGPDVVVTEAFAGDAVFIPSGYAHFTVNPGESWLVTANWVASTFESEYHRVRKAGGAPFFLEADAVAGWAARPNPRIGMTISSPSLRTAHAAAPIFHLPRTDPELLDCLVFPERHPEAHALGAMDGRPS